ncbi:MAG: type III PLP-dependent enzyme [Rhodospirillales bacterium]|nr:type III PLP-dependent enzyme [Rhodospirillales bacterium]
MTTPFSGAEAIVSALRPNDPILLLRADEARAAARACVDAFPGTVAYAVKVCDRPDVLKALADGGIRHWDVASLHEVRAVLSVAPDAVLHYMNPIKALAHIAAAHDLGVRTFAFDCERELHKIAQATAGDREVIPVVRLRVPNDKARFPLDGKFGCSEAEATALLRLAVEMGYRPGITFHVGSQCESPDAYRVATEIACRVAVEAGIEPSILDIGGGFPAAYRGDEPSFGSCAAAAKAGLDAFFPAFGGVFQCEPGRLLAAPAASVLVRVELRKGNNLFLNDGYYGLLSELKWMTGLHPVRLVRPGRASQAPLQPFAFFGPTCDSIDAMEGPYHLPGDIDEGDWIEISLLGAYSTVLATRFNGFPEARVIEVRETKELREAA